MRFLLLSEPGDSFFKDTLAEILRPLGSLSVASANEGVPLDTEEPDGLIIIDATTIELPERLVARLWIEFSERRIIVITASPTWQRARAVFEAGAVDYLPKALPMDELLEAIIQAMQFPIIR